MLITSFALSCALLAAVACAQTVTLTSRDAPRNGNFEQGLAEWQTRHGDDAGYDVERGAEAHGGRQSARITVAADADESKKQAMYIARDDLPTKPGYYVFEFAMRTDLTQGMAGASISGNISKEQSVSLSQPGSGGPKGEGRTPWQVHRVVYRIEQPLQRVVVMLQVVRAQGTVWFDDVRWKKVDDETGRQLLIQPANNDFDDGFAQWSLRGGEGSEYAIARGDDAYEGGPSGLIHLTDDSRDEMRIAAYLARTDLPTEPGYYRFNYAARSELTTGNGGAHLIARLTGGETVQLARPGFDGVAKLQGTMPWQAYSIVYHVPADTQGVILQMEANKARGRIWYDAVTITKLTDEEGQAAMHEQNPQAPSMQSAGAQLLGQPCRIVNARNGKFFTDPSTGRNLLVINSCTANGAGIMIDYEAGTSKVAVFPKGNGGWDMVELEPGKLLFESLSPLYLIPVNVADGTVIEEEMVPAGFNNQYAWRLEVGPDGWVYFGSYPTCHAYRYQPATGKIEDLGKMGTKDNLYVRHVALTDDGWLICAVGTENQCTVAYNIATGEQIELEGATPSTVYSIDGKVYGAVFLGLDENNKAKRQLVQFSGETIRFEPLNIPAPPGLDWTWILPSSTSDRLLLKATNGTFWQVEQGGDPQQVWQLDLRGGVLVGIDDAGRAIGYRGQDYFVAQPNADTIDPKPITTSAPPTNMHFLRADPKGGVTSGPGFGQTLLRFDPARDLLENTPQVVDGGGEVYDGQWVDGKFYFIAYGGGDLAVWDPDQPWDQWNGVNPKVVAKYNGEDHHRLIRPQGGMAFGPGGRLYAGLSAAYGTVAGGIAEYDPATGVARSWSNDIIAPEVSIGTVGGDDKYVYAVTSNHFNGLQRPPKELTFFAFDPDTEQVVYQKTLDGESNNRIAIVRVPDTGHVWVTDTSGIHRFDPRKLEFVQTIAWPREVGDPNVHGFDARGSRAWFVAGQTVVRLDDGDKPTATARFQLDSGTHDLAAGYDGKLYFTQNLTELWAAPMSR
jgi:outer membrane protein assembly factor BamB